MRRIRGELLRGQWPRECRMCQSQEHRGLPSRRQQESIRPEWRELMRNRDRLGEEPSTITYLELAFDNLCNLKCRMCAPRYSTRWAEDLPALARAGLASFVQWGSEVPMSNIDFEGLLERLGPAPRLMLKGGEPLLNKRLLGLLGRLGELGVAGRTSLTLVTNCTVLPKEFLRLAGRFHRIEVIASIDGTGPLHAYIRSGRFGPADIQRNLDQLLASGITVSITTAYQVYNMLDYPRLLRAYRRWTGTFSVTYVTLPWQCAFTAPDALRAEAAHRLESAIPELTLAKHSQAKLCRIVEDLGRGAFAPDTWQNFQRFTAALDGIRNESLAAVEPELARYAGLDSALAPAAAANGLPPGTAMACQRRPNAR